MPNRKTYDKKRMGPFTLDDFNALGVGDPEDMVRAYGSLEAARERYFYLRDTDQIPDGPHGWEAYYEFEAPEERPDEPDPREERRPHTPGKSYK